MDESPQYVAEMDLSIRKLGSCVEVGTHNGIVCLKIVNLHLGENDGRVTVRVSDYPRTSSASEMEIPAVIRRGEPIRLIHLGQRARTTSIVTIRPWPEQS